MALNDALDTAFAYVPKHCMGRLPIAAPTLFMCMSERIMGSVKASVLFCLLPVVVLL